MLTIEIKLNGRLIAGANILNGSALADVSNYAVEAVEKASPVTGHEVDFHSTFLVTEHPRRQSVWALVAKVATQARIIRASGKHDRPVALEEVL